MLLCEMERERLNRFDEEEDTLAPSTKKFKESHQLAGDKEVNQNGKVGSYRDKLVGTIPGAFQKAFGFDNFMQEDIESDNEEENSHEGSQGRLDGYLVSYIKLLLVNMNHVDFFLIFSL